MLPPLLDLLDPNVRKHICGPHESSNWVVPGRILVGESPRSNDAKASGLLSSLIQAGVRCFVCLQTQKEIDRAGHYLDEAKEIHAALALPSALPITFIHFPIDDGYPSDDERALSRLADTLVAKVMDDPSHIVYIHCLAGRGRTGILAAILLGKLYHLSAAESLRRTDAYYKMRGVSYGDSPEFHDQRMQVFSILK
eukprot:TRINITY_DN8346_c1_g2_i1.p1 TRINITY_DN8346_c1_g2~~TRINITY_DN8346_c1_g2_i1.p1  ORF type:complete len:196 (-),score=33.58 TRINITY_DN8346_c1_g2_i1:197-784(-)